MPSYAPGGGGIKAKGSALLSPPPRVGSLSLSSQKSLAHTLSLLSSIIIFGSVSNTLVVTDDSSSLTTFLVSWGVILSVIHVALLAVVYQSRPKDPWSPKMDMFLWGFIVLLWIPAVGVASSTFKGNRNVTTWFAWIGWGSSWFATLKAYHAWVESDLPTPNPEGFDDDDYIYG